MQYYSTVSEIERSEVWYNIVEKQEKEVSCPWVTSFTYSVSSEKSEEKRISQKIEEYFHAEYAEWDSLLHAYTFDAAFPVSGTISPFEWVPETFDSTRMVTYFGEDFMQHFKDSLEGLMQYADYKSMLLGMSLLDDFQQYTDSTQDLNAGDENNKVWIYHFHKDAEENEIVPDEVTELYRSIAFDQLVEGATGYNVSYKRSYLINAILRVYDIRGIYGLTVLKTIEIN